MDTATDRKTASLRWGLLKVLGKIDRPNTVCVSGDRPLTMPGLEVEGLGTVRLPLGKTQAQKLIRICRQAAYGKGTETVVDTDVRRVWELDPAQFQLTNSKWPALVDEIVEDVRRELGLDGCQLRAELYKLLVYEKGSFFLPHRDGEKVDRMVATLVIGLPAQHQGGELIVSHEGQDHEIEFAGAATGHELSFAAFYADCQHEVRPLRSGHRLCLTYNLAVAKSRRKTTISAPSQSRSVAAIGKLLHDWPAESEKLVITLEHRYTQSGLSVGNLKGADRARADVLFKAAEQADCVAHLGLVTLYQFGAADGFDYDYGHGYGHGYHWSDDEDEDEQDEEERRGGASQYSMGDIIDSGLSVAHWTDHHGKKVRLGELDVAEEELVSAKPLYEGDPSEEDFEGYTGNAGMTLERWYRRAAIVIWQRAAHFDVLCGAGTTASIGGLEVMVQRLKSAAKKNQEAQRRDCRDFARAIVRSWRPGHRWTRLDGDAPDSSNRKVFSELLCALDDPELMRSFLTAVLTADGDAQIGKSAPAFFKRHGWASFESELHAVIEAVSCEAVLRNAELLRRVSVHRDKDAERIKVCRRLCGSFVEVLAAYDDLQEEDRWERRSVNRAALLKTLVPAMVAVGAKGHLSKLISHATKSGHYDLIDAHLGAVFALESRLCVAPATEFAAVARWLSGCRRELERRTKQAPRKPTDHHREHQLSCECRDCRELSKFLANPTQRQARFPLAKDRRQHLHNIIDRDKCDCTHVTHRKGRPFTLVCTKTTASYDKACEIHQRDVKYLARLTALIENSKS